MLNKTPSTVGELIKELQKFDPDTDFLIMTEDEDIQRPNHGMRFFEVDSVTAIECERRRGEEDGVASVKLGKSQFSTKPVFITITSDI